jgi:hypothetical protein
MVNLVETVELLAAAAVQVDANDLPALGVMHSRLREFSQQLQSCEQPVRCASDLGNLAGSAERLVERIILRDHLISAEPNAEKLAHDQAGVRGCLRKPFTPEVLIERVTTTLSKLKAAA